MRLTRISSKLHSRSRSLLRRLSRRHFPTPNVADAKIVFVIAAPRSGTTWLQRVLNEHPDITCGENRLFGSYFDVVLNSADPKLRVTLDCFAKTLGDRTAKQDLGISPSDYADELIAEFSQIAFQKWRRYSGKHILVDKITPYPGTAHEVASQLQRFYPEAGVIQLIRDGRDVATSGVFHWMNRTLVGRKLSLAQLQRDEFYDSTAQGNLSRFFTDEEIRTWTSTWSEPIVAVNDVFGQNVLNIRYERMIENLADELSRICEFVGARTNRQVLSRCVKHSSFHRMSGGRARGVADPAAHVRKGIVGDWKNYFTRHDGELLQAGSASLLQDLGYETDADWPLTLPGTLNITGVM